MKKLLKISFALTSASTFPLISINCKRTERFQNEEQKYKFKEIKNFKENKFINEILKNVYHNNQKELMNYVNFEESIPYNKIEDLKTSLIYFMPFMIHSDSDVNAKSLSEISKAAKKNIMATLKQDWYWMLKNIKNMEFMFNPYADKYQKNSSIDEKKLFDEVEEKLNFKDWIFSFNNIDIQEIFLVNIEKQKYISPEDKKEKEFNNYFDKKAVFVFLNEKTFVKFYLFSKDSKDWEIQMIPDIYYLPYAKSIDEIKTIITKNEEESWKLIKDDLEKRLKQSLENSKNDPDEEYEEDEIVKQYIDSKILTLFEPKYLEFFIKSINNWNNNNEKNKIYRFTWRFINE